MRPTIFAVTLLMLLGLPFGPATAAEVPNQAVAFDAVDHQMIADPGPKSSPVLLFYALDDDLVFSTGDTLRFEISVDGDVVVEEVRALAPATAEPGVVELLSRHPQVLEQINRASARGHQVQVTVLADGRVLESVSFEELRARDRAFRSTMPLPRQVESRLLSSPGKPAADLSADRLTKSYECVDICESERRRCYRECGNPRLCLDDCDADYHACIASLCDCVPTSHTVVESEIIIDTYYDDWQCFYRAEYGQSYLHRLRYLKVKYTEKRIVTNPDCSTTVTILQVSYKDGTCYSNLWSICTNPVPIPAIPGVC